MIGSLEIMPTTQLTFPAIVEAEHRAALAAAKAAPAKHRATLVFDRCASPALNYAETEIPVRGARGTVRFGWTMQPNAAGYFLIFRETVTCFKRAPARTVRDVFDSTIRKGDAAATCRRLADAFAATQQDRRKR
jgi:hypothetical protein